MRPNHRRPIAAGCASHVTFRRWTGSWTCARSSGTSGADRGRSRGRRCVAPTTRYTAVCSARRVSPPLESTSSCSGQRAGPWSRPSGRWTCADVAAILGKLRHTTELLEIFPNPRMSVDWLSASAAATRFRKLELRLSGDNRKQRLRSSVANDVVVFQDNSAEDLHQMLVGFR